MVLDQPLDAVLQPLNIALAKIQAALQRPTLLVHPVWYAWFVCVARTGQFDQRRRILCIGGVYWWVLMQ